MAAFFAENSGFFEVVRVHDAKCTDCDGSGTEDVTEVFSCETCEGAGASRRVVYR